MCALCIISFSGGNGSLKAQSLSKYYTFSSQKSGILFFIKPKKLKNTQGEQLFIYDITSLSTSDSITLNFSYFTQELNLINRITFAQAAYRLPLQAHKIFIAPKKKNYLHRYGVRLLRKDFETLLRADDAFFIRFDTKKGSRDFYPDKKRWQKQRRILRKVLDIVRINEQG